MCWRCGVGLLGRRYGGIPAGEEMATHINPGGVTPSMSASYVIIGDGIAGSSAAEAIHEEAPDADITVLTDEGETLYNRILIKEYAKGKLPEALISIHDPEWYDERDIDIQLNTLVTRINPTPTRSKPTRAPRSSTTSCWWRRGHAQRPPRRERRRRRRPSLLDVRGRAPHPGARRGGRHRGCGRCGPAWDRPGGDLWWPGRRRQVSDAGNRWWRYALSEAGAEIIHEGSARRASSPSSSPAWITSRSTTTAHSRPPSTGTASATTPTSPGWLSAWISTWRSSRTRTRPSRTASTSTSTCGPRWTTSTRPATSHSTGTRSSTSARRTGRGVREAAGCARGADDAG